MDNNRYNCDSKNSISDGTTEDISAIDGGVVLGDKVKPNNNKMGYMPIDKLLLSMSAPLVISMIIQALYNIVDSIFVARLSEDALTAVSMAFPMQAMLIGVGVGIGIGSGAVLSRALGSKEYHKVGLATNNGFFLGAIAYGIFCVVGIVASPAFYKTQTDNATIIRYGVEYMRVCLPISCGFFVQVIGEKLLQATGRTIYSMIAMITGAVVNIILDPIMIFGLFGFPRLEVRGAAIATVIGQLSGATVAIIFNLTVNKEIGLSVRKFKIDVGIIKNILQIGSASIVMQSIGSIVVYAMNRILMGFTSTAIAVFGIFFKLYSFVIMPVFGLNSAMIPIVAYNYGANSRDRLIKAIKLSVTYATIIMALGAGILVFFPVPLLRMFDATDNMIKIGVPAIRTVSPCFVLAGYSIVLSGAFQALGKGMYSLLVSVGRQAVVLLPVAYLLSLSGKLENVWWCYPIAEVIAMVLSTVFIILLYKGVISKMPTRRSCNE